MKRGWGARHTSCRASWADRIVYEIFMEVKYWGNTHSRDKPDDKAPWKCSIFFHVIALQLAANLTKIAAKNYRDIIIIDNN